MARFPRRIYEVFPDHIFALEKTCTKSGRCVFLISIKTFCGVVKLISKLAMLACQEPNGPYDVAVGLVTLETARGNAKPNEQKRGAAGMNQVARTVIGDASCRFLQKLSRFGAPKRVNFSSHGLAGRMFALLFFGLFLMLADAPSFAADEATMVGDKRCYKCHDTHVDGLEKSIHAKTELFGKEGTSCEGCHGPGSVHVKSKRAEDIINPSKLRGEEASKSCVGCHENTKHLQQWMGSAHESAEVGCVNCHSVHQNNPGMLKADSETDTCVACHREVRSDLHKRSTHPLTDVTRADGTGKMSCSSCHNAHGSVGERLVDANTVNDKCYECHQEKKAPVLWEHSAVKESCLNCHNPHGTNHEMMLTAKEPRLCQQCHEQGRHQSLAGEAGSFFVANRGCSNCHAAIHGTNNPSGIKIKH